MSIVVTRELVLDRVNDEIDDQLSQEVEELLSTRNLPEGGAIVSITLPAEPEDPHSSGGAHDTPGDRRSRQGTMP